MPSDPSKIQTQNRPGPDELDPAAAPPAAPQTRSAPAGNIDALASNFLTELNSLSSQYRLGDTVDSTPAPAPAGLSQRVRSEKDSGAAGAESGVSLQSIEAELAETLNQLEKHESRAEQASDHPAPAGPPAAPVERRSPLASGAGPGAPQGAAARRKTASSVIGGLPENPTMSDFAMLRSLHTPRHALASYAGKFRFIIVNAILLAVVALAVYRWVNRDPAPAGDQASQAAIPASDAGSATTPVVLPTPAPRDEEKPAGSSTRRRTDSESRAQPDGSRRTGRDAAGGRQFDGSARERGSTEIPRVVIGERDLPAPPQQRAELRNATGEFSVNRPVETALAAATEIPAASAPTVAGGTPTTPSAPPSGAPVSPPTTSAPPVTSPSGSERSGAERPANNTANVAEPRRLESPALPPIPVVMKPAEPIQKVAPVYPRSARSLRIGGRVEVEAEIDENGSVSGAKAVSGPTPLRSAAHDAVLKWTFKPATRNGLPVRSRIKISVIFNP